MNPDDRHRYEQAWALKNEWRRSVPSFDVEKVGNSFIVTQDGEPVEHPRRHASWDEARGRAAELRRGK